MSGLTLGIDPGQTGAIAALDADGDLLWVRDMPYADGHVLAPQLAEVVLEGNGRRIAWVERAQSMPGMGVSGVFTYGMGYGCILGVLGALAVPTMTVRPHTWKGQAGLSADKEASRRRAMELWPAHSALFARVKDDGRAEACLIARHGWLAERKAAA